MEKVTLANLIRINSSKLKENWFGDTDPNDDPKSDISKLYFDIKNNQDKIYLIPSLPKYTSTDWPDMYLVFFKDGRKTLMDAGKPQLNNGHINVSDMNIANKDLIGIDFKQPNYEIFIPKGSFVCELRANGDVIVALSPDLKKGLTTPDSEDPKTGLMHDVVIISHVDDLFEGNTKCKYLIDKKYPEFKAYDFVFITDYKCNEDEENSSNKDYDEDDSDEDEEDSDDYDEDSEDEEDSDDYDEDSEDEEDSEDDDENYKGKEEYRRPDKRYNELHHHPIVSKYFDTMSNLGLDSSNIIDMIINNGDDYDVEDNEDWIRAIKWDVLSTLFEDVMDRIEENEDNLTKDELAYINDLNENIKEYIDNNDPNLDKIIEISEVFNPIYDDEDEIIEHFYNAIIKVTKNIK